MKRRSVGAFGAAALVLATLLVPGICKAQTREELEYYRALSEQRNTQQAFCTALTDYMRKYGEDAYMQSYASERHECALHGW